MRIVIQRVKAASVSVNETIISKIETGLLVLVGIETSDDESDCEWLCRKIVKMRLFDDTSGVMNLSLQEAGADLLVVSQFTLHANTKKGNRPSYIKAARPEQAIPLYEKFIQLLEKENKQKIQTGSFGAMMAVSLINDGPVTIIIDSKNRE